MEYSDIHLGRLRLSCLRKVHKAIDSVLMNASSGQHAYTARSIQLLTGLEPIRKRPGMYTDTANPEHLVQEVLDNSIDEALAGYATEIELTLFVDGSVEVVDNGRGMPVDIHPEHQISGIELILTRLHAGGKFDNDTYSFAGGLHGVGVSVVNALSARLEVSVRKAGSLHKMSFANGLPTTPLHVAGRVGRRNTGTGICFWPDYGYFDSREISVARLRHLLRAKAVLCPGLLLVLRIQQSDLSLEEERWHHEGGISGYLAEATAGTLTLPEAPFHHAATIDGAFVDWSIQWCPELPSAQLINESYVNLIPTTDGGTHVNGLRSGCLKALEEFCEFQQLLPKNLKLTTEDLWAHCSYVLAVKCQEPQFQGQTKNKLSSRQAGVWVSTLAKDSFSLWLNQHTSEAQQLATLIIERAQSRQRLARQVDRKKATLAGPRLPGKLADCSRQGADGTEIFLVEGDSAGGSARQGRDREFQAVLPLRGKILNAWELEADTALKSQEINHIAIALGINLGDDQIDGLRYEKVCILADADPDGLHIATLLCALFLRHFRALVAAGHLYVAMSPLYRVKVDQKIHYALDHADKDAILAQAQAKRKSPKISIQRFKGLGEMNPLQLRETTMNPETRRLVRLTIDDLTCSGMDLLLAKKRAADRRVWIEQHAAS